MLAACGTYTLCVQGHKNFVNMRVTTCLQDQIKFHIPGGQGGKGTLVVYLCNVGTRLSHNL